MENINLDMVKENSLVKFINKDKAFFDGFVIKIEKNCIVILINLNQSTYKELKKNEDIQLVFIYESQAIKCGATIIGSKIGENEQVVIIDMPKVLLKIERREFDRIDIVMDIEYSQLPDGVEYEKLSNIHPIYFRRYKKTYTIDISAGGVNLVFPIKEKECKFVLVALSVSDKNITSLCVLIRSEAMDDGKYKKMAYKFVDIEKENRQLIFDFVKTKLKEQ